MEKQTCTCTFRWGGAGYDPPCPREIDPRSGEALLCTNCLNDTEHMAANSVPKRLPKRQLT